MARFRMNELRQLHSKLGSLLEEYDELKAAESGAATDNEQPTGGSKAPAAATNSGSAQDSAPSLDTRTGRKGLTHVPNTAATRALHNMPGYNRLTK
jgi:hypothetical protein